MRVTPGPDLRAGAAQTGVDDDGVVLVRVGADGSVTAVEVSRRWAERLREPEALAAAILTAYRQALLKRMAARLITDPGGGAVPLSGMPLGGTPVPLSATAVELSGGPVPLGEAASLPDVADDRWRDGVRQALELTCRAVIAGRADRHD
ncbi:hypothetical protein [Actinoplanes sp. NPDC020271]|uniref:hypothetical protein n=1 Tax=Actinoplanes sp. NPDC020271 TaxID=3363896 RepID=UPI003787A676